MADISKIKVNNTSYDVKDANHRANTSNPHSVTKAQVGLGNVENKSSATIRGELTKANVTDALGYTPIDPSTTGTVTGVKGNSESSYRTGNVNITAANIGLGNVNNTADANKNVLTATRLLSTDVRNDNQPPSWYMTNKPKGITVEFKATAKIGVDSIITSTYCNLITITPWSDSSGGRPVQIAVADTGVRVQRVATSDSAWGSWVTLPNANTTYGVVSKSANGLAPKLPNETTTTKYLRQDGTWQVPPNTTYGVVSKTANGLAPQLPNETTTTKYLRQDGTWVVPPNTTYGVVSKTANGLAPQLPNETTTTKYLRQDGTWVVPPNTTYSTLTQAIVDTGTETTGKLITAKITRDSILARQPKTATATLAVASWSNGVYSFESSYPVATYDIEIEPNGDSCTAAQLAAWSKAQIVGSATKNQIKALGTVPTVAIPVMIRYMKKT